MHSNSQGTFVPAVDLQLAMEVLLLEVAVRGCYTVLFVNPDGSAWAYSVCDCSSEAEAIDQAKAIHLGEGHFLLPFQTIYVFGRCDIAGCDCAGQMGRSSYMGYSPSMN